jgi:hypothetical protein
MSQGPLFIRPEVFAETLQELRTLEGTPYQDVNTIYGDMSRLVVAWLASAPPEDLRSLYNQLSWKGNASIRPIQEAARMWLRKHHPKRAAQLGIPDNA